MVYGHCIRARSCLGREKQKCPHHHHPPQARQRQRRRPAGPQIWGRKRRARLRPPRRRTSTRQRIRPVGHRTMITRGSPPPRPGARSHPWPGLWGRCCSLWWCGGSSVLPLGAPLRRSRSHSTPRGCSPTAAFTILTTPSSQPPSTRPLVTLGYPFVTLQPPRGWRPACPPPPCLRARLPVLDDNQEDPGRIHPSPGKGCFVRR